MKTKLRQLLRVLQLEYLGFWVFSLLLVFLYEQEIFVEGFYAGDATMDYVLQSLGILLALVLIPLSLRLFSFSLWQNVKQRPLPEALPSYRRWSEVRLSLLWVVVLFNLSAYYLTLNTTGVFCAGMAAVASLFCVPTRQRLWNELDLVKEDPTGL
ncbi:hypothetical protein, membrane [gut metagenome]|uniref:Transmembrane protein n=1 Tax=gut metagenome TaxID=749906 RepID=J9FVQ0_9ZZZZ